MPRKVVAGDSEFGLGPGLLDASARADRLIGSDAGTAVMYQPGAELREIYATDPAAERPTPAEAVIERPQS